jgi:hypothetical protein
VDHWVRTGREALGAHHGSVASSEPRRGGALVHSLHRAGDPFPAPHPLATTTAFIYKKDHPSGPRYGAPMSLEPRLVGPSGGRTGD